MDAAAAGAGGAADAAAAEAAGTAASTPLLAAAPDVEPEPETASRLAPLVAASGAAPAEPDEANPRGCDPISRPTIPSVARATPSGRVSEPRTEPPGRNRRQPVRRRLSA